MHNLLREITIARADGSYPKKLAAYAKTGLVALDDWGLERLTREQSLDLLELLEDRLCIKSTLVAAQVPIDHWHDIIGDPTLANAILDRLVNLAASEFIRRFLQHVLPKGFVRIRHYGLMAPKNVNTRLITARRLILNAQGVEVPQPRDPDANKHFTSKPWREVLLELTGIDLRTCPKCKNGRLVRRPIMKGEIMLCYEPAPIAA
jgi:hypothetical protein